MSKTTKDIELLKKRMAATEEYMQGLKTLQEKTAEEMVNLCAMIVRDVSRGSKELMARVNDNGVMQFSVRDKIGLVGPDGRKLT